MLFHEYFHAETGRGVGASHQTGWTALVASVLDALASTQWTCRLHDIPCSEATARPGSERPLAVALAQEEAELAQEPVGLSGDALGVGLEAGRST